MNECQKDILITTLIWYFIKGVILFILYLLLIEPNLSYENPAVSNLIKIAYGFLSIFVIFAMKGLNVSGLFSYKK